MLCVISIADAVGSNPHWPQQKLAGRSGSKKLNDKVYQDERVPNNLIEIDDGAVICFKKLSNLLFSIFIFNISGKPIKLLWGFVLTQMHLSTIYSSLLFKSFINNTHNKYFVLA